MPSRAFTVNGIGGTQPAALRRLMSAVATVGEHVAVRAGRSTVTGGVVGVEYASTKVLAVGRQADVVVGGFGREQGRLAAVEAHPVELLKYGSTPLLPAHAAENHTRAGLRVDLEHLGDHAVAGGDLRA